MNGKITYRKQFTRCGKQRCRKCREGAGHGPYWYAYWSEGGRTVSKYIGLQPPDELALQQSSLEEPNPSFSPQLMLRIFVLGQFRIERRQGNDWLSVDSRTWQRKRARALLGCLLSSPGRRLGREQVMELLWPDLDIDLAANRLNGAVHELRQILEPGIERPANSRLLRLERDILELADSTKIWVDAEAFEHLLKEAHSCTDLQLKEQLYEEATALYRGSYLLEELYAEWAAPRRDMLQRSWIGLLLDLAHLRAEQGRWVSAIEILDRLRSTEPTNETALQRQMILLTQLDRRGEALQLYRQHLMLLEREYESEPLPETLTLYDALRNGSTPELYTAPRPITAPLPDLREMSPAASPVPAPTTASTQRKKYFTRPIFQSGRMKKNPLVGREQEQAHIRQALLAIEAQIPRAELLRDPIGKHGGLPHFFLLRGELGIGKTRLAEELSLEAYARGWAVAWSRSYELERTIPYRPWTELLRALLSAVPAEELLSLLTPGSDAPALTHVKLERLSALLPDLADNPLLASRPAPNLPHEQERLLLWEATLGLLSALSSVHPLLLVLDDLHWADDSSIEVLTYLTHHLQEQHIFILATCRERELAPLHKLHTLIADLRREEAIISLPLQPLTDAQIDTMLSHLPQETISTIREQAAGNPFFAQELARYAEASETNVATQTLSGRTPLRQRESGRESTRTEAPLPEAISAILERRLSRLSTPCQALLSRAAILGGSFELRYLLPMESEQQEETVLNLLEEALQAGLLTEEGMGAHITYHFWHPLIISHLCERLSATRRALLHRRAAEALKSASGSAQQEQAAAIVHHLSKGGAASTQVATYAESAAHHAYALSGYSEARRYYLQAIHALLKQEIHTPENSEVQSATSTILAHDIIQLPVAQARSISLLLEFAAECHMILGDIDAARYLYSCLLAVYTAHTQTTEHSERDQQIRALLWRELGNSWCATSDYAQAYSCYAAGKEILVQANITSGPAWACLHLHYGDILRLDGRYNEARVCLHEALELLKDVVQAPPTTPTPGRPTTKIERALLGNPLELGYAHERLGVVAGSIGQFGEAFQHLHQALSLYEQHGFLTQMARICGNLGVAHLLKGENLAASSYMRRALQLAERTGDLTSQAFSMGNLADMTSRSGKLQEAEQWYLRSLALSDRITDREGTSWFNTELALVQKDLGHIGAARKSMMHALRIGRAIKSSRCIHYALAALGHLHIVEAALATQQNDVLTAQRYLHLAYTTLQRVLAVEGLEAEPTIEGKYLMATIYYRQSQMGKSSQTDKSSLLLAEAEQLAQSALQEALENEMARTVGRVHCLLGMIAEERHDSSSADASFAQSLSIFDERDLRLDYARTLSTYGTALLQRSTLATEEGRPGQKQSTQLYQRGLTSLQQAQDIFTSCKATLDLAATERVLEHYALYATR